MALRLAKRLLTNNILDYINLNNDVEITEISITQVIAGKTVLEPVSYTHLDVYKRQIWRNGRWSC